MVVLDRDSRELAVELKLIDALRVHAVGAAAGQVSEESGLSV